MAALKSLSSPSMDSPFCSKLLSQTLCPFRPQIKAAFPRRPISAVSVRAQTLDFSAEGGMYVEVFNRGVIPLAYNIKKKNKARESNTYLDGIYLLFSYFTKTESIEPLEAAMKTDDVIRSCTFKVRKRKY